MQQGGTSMLSSTRKSQCLNLPRAGRGCLARTPRCPRPLDGSPAARSPPPSVAASTPGVHQCPHVGVQDSTEKPGHTNGAESPQVPLTQKMDRPAQSVQSSPRPPRPVGELPPGGPAPSVTEQPQLPTRSLQGPTFTRSGHMAGPWAHGADSAHTAITPLCPRL